MRATAWRNGGSFAGATGYGIKLGGSVRDRHLDKTWDGVFIELEGSEPATISVGGSFRQRCTELRSVAVSRWLIDRPIHAGRNDICGSGLKASDTVPAGVVAKVRAAAVAALEAQRRLPGASLAEMADRFGDDRTDDAPEGWRMLGQFAFTDCPMGSMDAAQRATTLDFPCATRGLPVPAGRLVYPAQFPHALARSTP